MDARQLISLYTCTNPDCNGIFPESVEGCPKCGWKVKFVDLSSYVSKPKKEKTDQEWIEGIYENEELWLQKAFEEFPSVVAHEYWRLRELCRHNQPYGVLFQIRDLIEATLKYQILSVCAWASHMQVPRFREEVGSSIAVPGMVLGKWVMLGRKIEHFFGREEIRRGDRRYHMPSELWQSLKLILSSYEDAKVVNWRNEHIGHGALGFSQDAAFRDDVEKMLAYFKTLFGKLQKNYSAQELFIGRQSLRGKDRARNLELPLEHEPLSLRLTMSGVFFSVEPYMSEVEGGIYFFDNQKSRMLSQMLCYPIGRRENRLETYFSELFDLCPMIQTGIAVDGRFISWREEELIDSLGAQTAFVEPKHLTLWLRGALREHQKGVFLLKMCRGTGKSTYSEKLSLLGEKPVELSDDLDVRTYHIVRTQMITARDFERHIEHLWTKRDVGGVDWTRAQHISEYRAQGSAPAQALSLFLGQCLEFTRARRRRERILMVIDGLDEIVDEQIWCYLPAAQQLPDGVYVLLTSRDPEQEGQELPERIVRHIKNVRPTRQLSVRLESKENNAFLKMYLMSAKLDGLSDGQQQELIRQAGYRVLYFGMLCRLVQAGEEVRLLSSPEKLVTGYLNVLQNYYGEKESMRLRELLSILCTLGCCEPLSLKEIATLAGNGEVTIDLASKISDLTPLLKVDRGFKADSVRREGMNRYSLANSGLVKGMRSQLPESIAIAKGLIKTSLVVSADAVASGSAILERVGGEIDENAAALLVLAHMEDLLQHALPEEDKHRIVKLSDYVGVKEAGTILRFIEWAESMPGEEALTDERKNSALRSMHRMAKFSQPQSAWVKLDLEVLLDMQARDMLYAEWSVDAANHMAQCGQLDEALLYLQNCLVFIQEQMDDGNAIYSQSDLSVICDGYAEICVRNARWAQCAQFCERHWWSINRFYFLHKSLVNLGRGIDEQIVKVITTGWLAYLRENKQPINDERLEACYPFVRLFRERIAGWHREGRHEEAGLLSHALADVLLGGWEAIMDQEYNTRWIWTGFGMSYAGEALHKGFERVCQRLHEAGKEEIVRAIIEIFKEQIDPWLELDERTSLWAVCDLFERFGFDDDAIELLQNRMLRGEYDRGDVLFRLARLYRDNGRFEQALETMEQILAPGDDSGKGMSPAQLQLTAEILDELGREREAEAYRRLATRAYMTGAQGILRKWKASELKRNRVSTRFEMDHMVNLFLTAVEQHILLDEWGDAAKAFQMLRHCGWPTPEKERERMSGLSAKLAKYRTDLKHYREARQIDRSEYR